MIHLTSNSDNSTDALVDFLGQLTNEIKSFHPIGEVETTIETEIECQFYANFFEWNYEEQDRFDHSITFYSNASQTEFWGDVELTY